MMKNARKLIDSAERIAVLTGAGVSAESGVPTFRGEDGLWRNRRAVELATPQAFEEDPALVWEFYNWRRDLISKVLPNDAHRAIAGLQKRVPGLTLVTQNVDGLHQAAGSTDVVEIHGNLWRTLCTGCKKKEENMTVPLPVPARCGECGELIRPDVVWFGESLDPDDLSRAFAAAEKCDVMLVVGTSAVVYPAAGIAFIPTKRGKPVIEVNLEPTPLSNTAAFAFHGKAGDILPELIGGE